MDAVSQIPKSNRTTVRSVLASLRLHQWAKNLLIFVPIVLAGKAGDLPALAAVCLGFLAWGLVASSLYVLNDLRDCHNDQLHWSKKWRPIASGKLSPRIAAIVAGAILFTGLALCVPLGPMAIMTLVIYGLASASYTLSLKKIAILDVLILSSLFTLRLVFGIVVANVAASAWLLVLSLFLFTSLSLGKRYVETARAAAHGLSTLPGRGYVNSDAPFLMASGIATSMSAVLILVLYLIEEAFNAAIYSTPELLWLSPLILFWWLSRVWLLIGRNSIDDDPVTFALTDPASLLLGSAMLITFMGAWLY